MTYEQMLAILEKEKLKRRGTVQVLAVVFGGVIISVIILALLGKLQLKDLASLCIPLALGWYATFRFTPQAKSALIEAAKSGDSQLVGHLAEALACGDQELVKQARSALMDIFPYIQDSAIPLDRVQHAAFIHGIHDAIAEKNFAFASDALLSLAYIGRPESIATLESLAEPYPTGFERVQHASLKALPELRMRLAKDIIARKIEEVDARREELIHH